MIKEEQLLEQKELRNKLVSRVDILEKVKSLLLIPQTDFANTKQVADFYEVNESNVKMLYAAHKDEFNEDGVCNKNKDEIRKSTDLTTVKEQKSQTKVTFIFDNGFELDVPNRGIKTFPRRAILRVGMLLRDSEVAKRVRTALLDIEEKTSIEVKVQDIDEEQKLAIEIGMNYISGNLEQFAIASTKMMAFKNRHIEKLQQDNKALAGEILTWKDRAKMNHAIRSLAGRIHKQIGVVWNDLYQNLYYQYSISVKARGGTPFIQHIREDEWDKVIKTFSAMCTQNNISPSDIFTDVNRMTEVSKNER